MTLPGSDIFVRMYSRPTAPPATWARLGFVLAFFCLAVGALMALAPPAQPRPSTEGPRYVRLLDDLARRVNAIGVTGLDLQGPCILLMHLAGQAPLPIDLRAARVETETSAETGDLELYVRRPAKPRRVLLLATSEWFELAAVHSDLNQLRARCARGTQP